MKTNKTNKSEWNDNETILNNFKNLENKDTNSIISFLSICNAKLLAKLGTNSVTEKIKEEIIEFFDYFIDNHEKQTRKSRLQNWPNDALILRAGYEYRLEKELLNMKKQIESFSYEIQDEAEELRDIIFKIRKDKVVTIAFLNGTSEALQIPGTIQKEYLENFKLQTHYYFCLMIKEGGSAVVRVIENKKHFNIFGVFCHENKWHPISKDVMEHSHNHDQYGNPLEPEKGVTFTQISKPIRYTA